MIASAMSSGVATRPSGAVRATIAGRSGMPARAWMPVSVVPACTAFTRTPSGPASLERPMVNASSAAFDAA